MDFLKFIECILVLFLFLFKSTTPQNVPQNGYDPNWWVPDIVTIKHDPYDMIASNYGQPQGEYNWNTDQFQLLVNDNF